MTPAQLAAVSYLARYSGHTNALYAHQLRRWFSWREANGLEPLVRVQRAHVELYVRTTGLRAEGLLDLHRCTAVRGLFRFANVDGLIPADPAVYVRLPKIHSDETAPRGRTGSSSFRFLRVAPAITVHHGAPAYLLGIDALRASEAAAVRIEDYAETHRVLHLVGKGSKPATMPLTVPVLRVLEACRGQRTQGPLVLRPHSGRPIDRRDVDRMVSRIAKVSGIPRHVSPHSLRRAAITNAPTPESHSTTRRSSPDTHVGNPGSRSSSGYLRGAAILDPPWRVGVHEAQH